ncbi:hypothetical protein B1218_37125, partial [Pseudomonas ogarae]
MGGGGDGKVSEGERSVVGWGRKGEVVVHGVVGRRGVGRGGEEAGVGTGWTGGAGQLDGLESGVGAG